MPVMSPRTAILDAEALVRVLETPKVGNTLLPDLNGARVDANNTYRCIIARLEFREETEDIENTQ